jgi:ankyrin repeat protein
MVDAAISAGLAVDPPPARRRQSSESDDDHEGSALANLASSYQCDDESTRMAVAERLLAHGADPNRRDALGQTAIFGVENLELLNLLLARGADPRAVDYDGNSAVFESWTDEIVLRLLQAGASPTGRYYDGRTLAEQTRERSMPRTAAWLASRSARHN